MQIYYTNFNFNLYNIYIYIYYKYSSYNMSVLVLFRVKSNTNTYYKLFTMLVHVCLIACGTTFFEYILFNVHF